MSPIAPLTQEATSPQAFDSAKVHSKKNAILEAPMLRWTIAGLMIAGLAWMMFFSHEKTSEIPSASQASANLENSHLESGLQNGTRILVRAHTIADPNQSSASHRSFSGTLQARYQSMLGFRIAGKIIQRSVEVGDRVQKGQVLFKLDPTDYDLQLQVARADLEAAKSQLVQIQAEEQRLSILRKTQSASQSDYDLALAARDTARSRLQAAINREMLAQNQRQYADLTADQDGLLTRLIAEVGQVVSAGQPVAQWVHGTELEAVVSIPESMQSALRECRAAVEFWSSPGISIPCQLREISPVADPSSRTYDARFTLVNPPKDLAIGMTANVVIYRDQDEGVAVPMSAIAQSQNKPIVWRILEQGHLQAVPVEILKYGSQTATVKGSLAPGDQIISAGVQRIDSQCQVRIWQDNL